MQKEFKSAPSETLVQALDEVEIGQKPPVAIDVGFAVGRGKHRTNKFDSGGIGRHELSPESSISTGNVQSVNLGWQITTTVYVQGMAIRSPSNRHFSRLQSFNWLRIAGRNWKEITFFVGADGRDLVTVGR